MGDLDLPNRIVMAPLTRMRAGSIDHVPTALQAEYYAQRASAGLIVAEATAISPDGFGYADTPGLWSADQVRGWRLVTDAVHAVGGRIVAQLWHTGAVAHPDVRGGSQPLSASDVDLLHESVTPSDIWPKAHGCSPTDGHRRDPPNRCRLCARSTQRNGGRFRRIGNTRRLSLLDPSILEPDHQSSHG
jgi:hypothetical protein